MTIIERETRETRIRVELLARGETSQIATTSPFLDHMLATLSRYADLPMRLTAAGDLRHHLVEDVAIALGAAVAAHAGEGIARYADVTVPMDDALVQAALDLGGRPYYRGPLPHPLYEHWMRSFADNARATLHLRVLRGRDRHHVLEAGFKALGFALRAAMAPAEGVFSTKGAVRTEAR